MAAQGRTDGRTDGGARSAHLGTDGLRYDAGRLKAPTKPAAKIFEEGMAPRHAVERLLTNGLVGVFSLPASYRRGKLRHGAQRHGPLWVGSGPNPGPIRESLRIR